MIDQTTEWARKAASGEIIVGDLVRLAAQRHLDDLRDGAKRGLTWDLAAAERAINFFPSVLSITEGAKEGEPFKLLPWHVFVVGSIYGWKDANGLRRFRFVWMETGKGQAKSPLMAGLGLYEIAGRKRRRAEVYCIGEDRKTANVMFRDAVAMCRAPIPDKEDETLESLGKVMIRGFGDNAWKIEHPASGSKFEPVANSDAISGPKPVLVLGDEIHEMKTNKAISIWRAAIAKMSGDPMMVLGTNTPSVDQHVGTEYSEFFQKVLRGEFTDDSAFAFIARTDKGDDPLHDESCWVKSLPALGITYPIENVRKEVETSRNMISTALTTKRLYFGIPVGTAGFWIAEDAWERVQGDVDEEEMVGRKLHLSLDLSEKNDLTALSGCWEGETLAAKTWYFTTGERVDERSTADQIPYREIEAAGQVTITATATIDYSFVVRQVADLYSRHDVEQMVVDSTFIQNFIRAADDAGFPVWKYEGDDQPEGVGLKIVPHAQGSKVVFEEKMLCMPLSMRHLEDSILRNVVVIDRNRLTTICASNAVVQSDAFKNKWFDKRKSRGRIDGMVTIAMAVGSAASRMASQTRSYLEEEELIIL
ncbi:terminase [Martelella lutilitoris]|uniref:Terminase n=1 Tax=Martelella lutilitoris TaxID=2583532 RepID=A0A7T7HMB0_9HYPH|nr:terminase TerL endonuclease subunit [Martelella lutilitoris]QQM31724.1 terminase [Martelella lutilitoris]